MDKKLPELKVLFQSESFRKRLPMYVGESRLGNIEAFLFGIYYGFEFNNITFPNFLNGFHDYVAKTYDWKESTAGWKNIILKESNYDEERAISTFFCLLDSYLKEQN